jgi:hypothetical protein
MKPPQGEERKRKKERDEEERERGAARLLAGQSHQFIRRDWSRAMSDGVAHGHDSAHVAQEVTP